MVERLGIAEIPAAVHPAVVARGTPQRDVVVRETA